MEQVKETSYGIIPVKKENDDWKIFLIQHKNGMHWGFPKGKPNAEESPKDAAIRELKEETNFDVARFLSDLPMEEEYHFFKDRKEVQKKVFYYIVEVQGEPKLQPEEIEAGNWFAFSEAYSKITFNESKFIFSKVQEMIRRIHS